MMNGRPAKRAEAFHAQAWLSPLKPEQRAALYE
jgi:hypothetical protein